MLSCFKYVVLFDKMSQTISSVQNYLIVLFHIYVVTFDLAVVLSQTRMCVTNLGDLFLTNVSDNAVILSYNCKSIHFQVTFFTFLR